MVHPARGRCKRFQVRPAGSSLKEKDKNMNGPARFWVLAVTLAAWWLRMSGCNQLAARDQLNKGVDAYKSAHYDEAIEHFQKATELDPNLPMAKTYLATALAQNVVPGMTTPENLKNANQAIDIFKRFWRPNPNDVNSMKQIAGIYFSINQLEDAKSWQKKVLAVDPKDPEAAYTIGVIDWTEGAQESSLQALAGGRLQRRRQRQREGAEEGHGAAGSGERAAGRRGPEVSHHGRGQSPQLRRCHAYMNLIYRDKADVDYGNTSAVDQDLAQAQDWSTKAMGMRKANEQKKNAGPGGITMGTSGQMQ